MKRDEGLALDRIADCLASQRGIRLGIVFGSMARGEATSDSDLDVAVLAEKPLQTSQRMRLIRELSLVAGRPVDLVDLRTAGVPVARSALLQGKVVFSRDSVSYPEQLSRLLIDSADFLPYRNRLLKQRREAWIR